ncbi:MAG: phosphotransferase [Parvibaculaceae bacterium]
MEKNTVTLDNPPLVIEELSVDWLNMALANAKIDAVVERFSTKPIGAGMLGSTYKISLEFSRNHNAPASLVLKVAGQGEFSRKTGRIGYGLIGKPGFFGTEVFFYQNIAEQTAVRAPKCYFAWLSEDGGHFALLLEDVSPARAGDELAGCTLTEAKLALANLAGLHAPMWNNAAFEEPGILARPTLENAGRFGGFMAKSVEAFHEKHKDRFSSDVLSVITRFAPHFERWHCASGRNMALTHNDYRLDNLLFTESDTPECVAVDWQTFMVAHPGSDVGLMLGASVPTEIRRAHEEELLRAYYDRLTALGVKNYSFDECVEDFCFGTFLGVKNAVIGLRAVTMTDRGLAMFDVKLKRACATILDHDALSLLE